MHNRKKIAIVLAAAMLITGTLNSDSIVQAGEIQSEEVQAVVEETEIPANEQKADGEIGDGSTGTTDTETPETTQPVDETPAFVSPVKINKKADIKLGSGSTNLTKVLYGSSGTIDISTAKKGEWKGLIKKLASRTITSDSMSISPNATGGYNYVATHSGYINITVTYQLEYDPTFLTKSFTIYVTPDMSSTYLEQSTYETTYDGSPYRHENPMAVYRIGGVPGGLTLDANNTFFSYTVSGSKKVNITSASVSGNCIYVYGNGNGTKTITATVNGKEFVLTYQLHGAQLNKTTALIGVKKSVQLKVKNLTYTDTPVWTSSKPSVAEVSETGLVTAKSKAGTTIIRCQVGGYTFAAAVNVAKTKKLKALNKIKDILKVSTYSQPKRMTQGYYDCSSLVWRAFKDNGCNFGIKSGWAPVAAYEGQYLVNKGKKICEWDGSVDAKCVQKMKMQPGDLFFGTGANNGRYRGIDHVETVTGYDIFSMDSEGNVKVIITWANRATGYGRASFFCRPLG